MLNEMNPKLKALLAAGLIGTAGLGMQSCSNPSDPVYYPYTVGDTTYTVDAPSTDNPGSGGGTENPGNGGGEENPNPSGGNGGETVKENKVTFEDLGVTDETDQRRIADTTAIKTYEEVNTDFFKQLVREFGEEHVYLYTGKTFQYVSEVIDLEDSRIFTNLIEYAKEDNYYYIPESMKESFDRAIDAYKASQSNR